MEQRLGNDGQQTGLCWAAYSDWLRGEYFRVVLILFHRACYSRNQLYRDMELNDHGFVLLLVHRNLFGKYISRTQAVYTYSSNLYGALIWIAPQTLA